MPSAVDVLRNIPYIWLISTGESTSVRMIKKHYKIALMEIALIQSALTKIFTLCNFGNTLAMTIMLFLKNA